MVALLRQPTRLLGVSVLALPPVLYLITFALSIATFSNSDFVRADRLTTGDPEVSGLLTNRTQHASPWFRCPATVGNDTDPDFFEEHCTRRPALGKSGVQACRDLDNLRLNTRICEKVVIAAETYTAGAVLSGLAFLAASLYAINVSLMREEQQGYGRVTRSEKATATEETNEIDAAAAASGGTPDATKEETTAVTEGEARGGPGLGPLLNRVLGATSTLMALLGSGCLVMGQIIAVAALVIEASQSISEPIIDQTRWYMGKGALQFTTAAYALGFIGAFVAATGCGLPRR